MKTIRDLFEHFKKNPQQFLTILTIFFSTSLLLFFSKRDEIFRNQNETENDALTSTLSSQLSTQVINHFSWFLGAAFYYLTEFGKLPGAMAQPITPSPPTSITYPPAQPTTAISPSIEISRVNNISNVVSARSNENATLIYLVGANGYCFATVDISDLFYPRILSTYGKTTEFNNHCSAITLNRNESYAFLANQKNGGITTVDISHPESPIFISNLPGFNAYAITLSQDEKYAFLASIGPSGYRIITIDIADLKNPGLFTVKSFRWSDEVSYIMSDSRLKLAMDIQTTQNDKLAFSWSAYIPSERSYETAINMIDAKNISNLLIKGRLSWAGQLAASGYPLNTIDQFSVSKDGKKLFLIASNKVPPYPGLSPSTRIAGPECVSIIDISNSSVLRILDSYSTPSADAAAFFSDEKKAIIANKNRGADIVNFDRFIKADPPIVESQWETTGFSNLLISPDNQFLFGVTEDALKIFLLRSALVMPINLLTLKTNIAAYALNIKLMPDHINAFVGRSASISLLTLNDANNPTRLSFQYPSQMQGYGGDTISLNSNDTKLFATYADFPQCNLFDVSNPRNPIRSDNSFFGFKTAAIFSPDDQYIFASYLNKIDALNASKISHNISKIFTQQNVRRLLSSKNKKILFASNGDTISFINFDNITTLTEIGAIRWDGASEMALSSDERFLFVGYSAYGETGLAVFDIRDLNASILLGTVMTGSAINQIKTSSDDRYLYLATGAGTLCVDVGDPAKPEIIFNAPTVSNALGIDLNENANLLMSVNRNSVNIFDINPQPFIAIPVVHGQLTADHPVLKSGENNIGKLLFLNSQMGSEQTTSQHQPLIQEIYLMDGETAKTVPSEFVINKKTGEFNIIPSEEMAGKTLTLRFKLGDHFFSDMSIPVVPGSGLTLKPTSPTSMAPSNLPATPITTVAPTTHASTVAPTVSTVSPTSIPTVAPTPRATDPIQDITFPPSLMPGETLAPSFTSPSENLLQINTTDQKIQIVSKATSLTLKIKLPKPGIGQFMLTSLNLGSVITTWNEPLGILTAVGSADDLNALLQHLRFSLNNLAYNQSQILLAVSQDGESAWTLALGNLNQLGENHAPVMTNSTYPNQSAEIGKSLVMPLTGNFQDPDNDPLNYEVTLSDGAPLPTWIQKRNNVLAGLCAQPEALQLRVTATDGYKSSPDSAAMNVTCQYFPPTVLHSIPNFIVKIGQGFVYSIPLTTFGGSGLHYDATLANGYPLPLGMSFDPNRFQLSGVINADATYNITISAMDAFQSSVNTTFKLSFFDHSPTVAKPITTQITKAGKTTSFKIPVNTFADLDDDPSKLSLSITQADGAPIPSWVNFDSDTNIIHVTPNTNALGKSIDLSIKASDGYKSVSTNFTLTVPTNQPPVIKERLPNVTAITGATFIYRIASNAFSSPENFTLTYLATLFNEENNKGKAPIPEWLHSDENVLSGTPGKDDVGTLLIKVTATDPLNDKVSQLFRIQVTLSLWDQIQYWLLRVGVPVSAAITLYGIYEYYEKRSIVLNTLTGNRYLLKKPFNENNELQVKCPKNLTLYPEYLQRIQPHELDCLNRFLTMLVWPSRYLRERHTLMPIEKPDWIRFNDVTNTLKVYPEAIPAGTTKSVIVQLRTASGRIYWQIKVNPIEFTQIELITSNPPDALTPENSSNSNSGGESRWQQPLLNQIPEKVTANPLSISQYHLKSGLFGQSTNTNPLPTNRVQRAYHVL